MSTAAAANPDLANHQPARSVARLWPAVALVALYWTAYAAFGLADVTNFHKFFGRMFAMAGLALLYLGWWSFSRRLPWRDRLLVFLGFVVIAGVVWWLLDPSFKGLQVAVVIWALPVMFTAWTVWLLATRGASRPTVRNGMLALAALAWAWSLFVRLDGLRGQGETPFQWRWTPTAEQQFLAERAAHSKRPPATLATSEPLVAEAGDWPSFRGVDRDGTVEGVKIATDWNESPPKQLWKRRVGPGWSSIVIVGNRLFTQEQREQNEAVVCFDADTGDEIWAHEDPTRFDESMGGVGPRATPTFADGRLYSLGANGMLNCLDAATGELKWSHDISKTGQSPDGASKAPVWGYSSSPLIVDGKAIVFAGGGGSYSGGPPKKAKEGDGPPAEEKEPAKESDKNTLLAYDAETGELAWRAPAGDHSYSSPQLAEFGGQQQVLFAGDRELAAYDPATGKVLWTLATNAEQSMPALQPHLLDDSQMLVSFNGDAGVIRARVSQDGDQWKVDSKWTSRDMKPFFNDFVRVGDALYGFDGSIFCSIDAVTGKRNWKKGRYGSGQVLLVADQPVLVVISESGDAVLVAADPEKHEELGRFAAIHGKTWNHPTIAHGRLYVRNAEEMACYELKTLE